MLHHQRRFGETGKFLRFICKVVDFRLRYNIASRSHVPVLVSENGQTTLKRMRWGLTLLRAKAETIGDKLTNIRADTITEWRAKKRIYTGQASQQICPQLPLGLEPSTVALRLKYSNNSRLRHHPNDLISLSRSFRLMRSMTSNRSGQSRKQI